LRFEAGQEFRFPDAAVDMYDSRHAQLIL
jgi:hypothetical protein